MNMQVLSKYASLYTSEHVNVVGSVEALYTLKGG